MDDPLIEMAVQELNNSGMRFDVEGANRLFFEKKAESNRLEREIAESLKIDPKDVAQIPPVIQALYRMGIQVEGLSLEALKKVKDKHLVLDNLYRQRKLRQFLSMYAERLPRYIGENGRVRGHWDAYKTVSGRWICTDFNIQSIPQSIKPYFVADPHNTLIISDYSQIELRVLAQLSKDAKLINLFREDGDVHTQMAAIVFRQLPTWITNQEREVAKKVNYAICYGASTVGLARIMKDSGVSLSMGKVEALRNQFYRSFQGVWRYQDRLLKSSFIMDLNGRKWAARTLSLAQRLNYPIQSSATAVFLETIRLLMVRKKPRWKLVNVIHDELILEVPETDRTEAKRSVESCMRGGFERYIQAVPFSAKTAIRNRWKSKS